jgi:vacuolar-type H+-ATPase subunit B/Vma2
MSSSQLRGKSIIAVSKDIAEGFFTINPLTLKKFDDAAIKSLHHQLKKVQTEVRNQKFPLNDVMGIRNRNMRLQRLHQALVILEHTAKERRVTF